MTLAGRRLLPREASELLYEAGWSDLLNLVTMVAVCQQEAQFWTEAVGGPNLDGSYDYGWPQINSRHAAEFGYSTDAAFEQACFDPVKAAGFARRIYVRAGYSFKPWSAYTSGAYRKYLGTAVIGVANMAAARLELTPTPFVKATSS